MTGSAVAGAERRGGRRRSGTPHRPDESDGARLYVCSFAAVCRVALQSKPVSRRFQYTENMSHTYYIPFWTTNKLAEMCRTRVVWI